MTRTYVEPARQHVELERPNVQPVRPYAQPVRPMCGGTWKCVAARRRFSTVMWNLCDEMCILCNLTKSFVVSKKRWRSGGGEGGKGKNPPPSRTSGKLCMHVFTFNL